MTSLFSSVITLTGLILRSPIRDSTFQSSSVSVRISILGITMLTIHGLKVIERGYVAGLLVLRLILLFLSPGIYFDRHQPHLCFVLFYIAALIQKGDHIHSTTFPPTELFGTSISVQLGTSKF